MCEVNRKKVSDESANFLYMPTANGNIKQERESKPLHTASGYIQFVYRNPIIKR